MKYSSLSFLSFPGPPFFSFFNFLLGSQVCETFAPRNVGGGDCPSPLPCLTLEYGGLGYVCPLPIYPGSPPISEFALLSIVFILTRYLFMILFISMNYVFHLLIYLSIAIYIGFTRLGLCIRLWI